jgi:hypothetical protein
MNNFNDIVKWIETNTDELNVIDAGINFVADEMSNYLTYFTSQDIIEMVKDDVPHMTIEKITLELIRISNTNGVDLELAIKHFFGVDMS